MQPRRATVLISQPDIRQRLNIVFRDLGYQAQTESVFSTPLDPALFEAEVAVVECSPDKEHPGLELAKQFRRRSPGGRLIVLASESSEELAIEALRLKAEEYLKAPFEFSRISATAAARNAETRRSDFPTRRGTLAIVGESASMREVKDSIPRIAETTCSVLILGETGTGKEMIAQEIHRRSLRSDRPFVCINCAAIPETLLESELFGHEKGAFTGAASSQAGKLAQAEGGTVFFDEIGDMSLQAQAKILRAIEAREIHPLGGRRKIALDVRIIAATNRELEAMVKDGRFRNDLFFRLNVARVYLPPLQNRAADIPLLVQHLLPYYNGVFGSRVRQFGRHVLNELMSYSWPGNIRELKNVMEVIFLNLSPGTTSLERLPPQVYDTWQKIEGAPKGEREQLLKALFEAHWNVSEAARKMHWSRMTVYRKLARYNISSQSPVTPDQTTVTPGDNI